TVPEQLTLALLGAGILGFGASRRRSAKKAA
ncbi:MAG: PEP-CTERM sorting domain-containing protein, partial [Janthinobacterium lividum]